MYKSLLYVLSLLFVISCSTDQNKTIQTYPGLESREGIYYQKGSDEPYTGITESNYNNGNPAITATFRSGKLNGIYTAYYANGQKMGISHYKMGIKHGESIGWHENGQMASRVSYEEGKKDGRLVVYYPNGQKMVEAFYKQDQLDGGFTQWSAKGELQLIKSYDEGELLWVESYGDTLRDKANI